MFYYQPIFTFERSIHHNLKPNYMVIICIYLHAKQDSVSFKITDLKLTQIRVDTMSHSQMSNICIRAWYINTFFMRCGVPFVVTIDVLLTC